MQGLVSSGFRIAVAASFWALSLGAVCDLRADETLPSDLTERLEVRLVELSVLALTSDGKPVTDLSAGDVSLVFEDEPIEIAFVQPAGEPVADAELPWARFSIEAGFQGAPATASARVPHYYLFFIDLENEPPPRRSNPGEALAAYARDGLREGDRAAVMSYSGGVRLELPFTTDREALGHTLGTVFERAGAPGAPTAQRVRGLARRLDLCEYVPDAPLLWGDNPETEGMAFDTPLADESCVIGVAATYRSEIGERAVGFFNALGYAVGFASSIQGRTTVVALTHGASPDADDVIIAAYRNRFGNNQINKVQQGLSRGGELTLGFDRLIEYGRQEAVTLHFVDASRPPAGGGGAQKRSVGRGLNPVTIAYTKPRTYLQHMADATGGILVAEPDLGEGLRRLRDAERGRYIVGFYSDVALDRKALAKLELSATDRKTTLLTSRNVERERRGVDESRGTIDVGEPIPLTEDREGEFLPLRFEVPQSALGHTAQGEIMVANLTLHVRLRTAEGRFLADSFHFFAHTYPAGESEDRRDARLAVRGWLEAEPGRYLLEGVFRNSRTGSEAVVEREIEIPR
jgi:VWFA-related protein